MYKKQNSLWGWRDHEKSFIFSSIFVTLGFGTVFTCLSTHMRMEVNLTKNPDLVPQEMHLNEPNCTATAFNDTFVLFEIPLDGCGTIQDGSNPDHLLFSNTAHWEAPGQPVTFAKDFKAHITCKYSRYGSVGVSVRIEPETEESPTEGKFCLPFSLSTHCDWCIDYLYLQFNLTWWFALKSKLQPAPNPSFAPPFKSRRKSCLGLR